MSIIYIMIPLALVLVGVAIWAMIWAIRTGQFDELESHGWTPVLDDDQKPRDRDPKEEVDQADPASATDPEERDRS